MANKKINQLDNRVGVALTDLSLVGDPGTGTSYKLTLQDISTLMGVPGKFNQPTGDTTQYIAGDGSLVAFPIAGQAGTLVREVRNVTGSTLTKGTVVYINGASANKPTVTKAIATGDTTSAQTFGIVQANISNNSNGYVVAVGDIDGLDTSALTEGAQLYLSATTAGAYTTTKQYAPNHLVYVGVVVRSHSTLGVIEVKIQNGYELAEIHDCAVQTPSNNDGLFYESATSLWKNATISAGVTVSDTPPSSPSVGDQWYNSVEGRTYVYYDSFWVDSNPGIVGPAGTNGTDGGFNSTQTIAALASGVTISSVDVGKLFTGGGATVTVQGLSVGQQVDFVQTSASQIIFAAGAGMTLNSKGGLLKTAAQYSPATIKCVATNTYVLLGDLGA